MCPGRHSYLSIAATDAPVSYAGRGRVQAGSYAPTLTLGEEFTFCVPVTVLVPLLPEVADANTAPARSSSTATATSTLEG